MSASEEDDLPSTSANTSCVDSINDDAQIVSKAMEAKDAPNVNGDSGIIQKVPEPLAADSTTSDGIQEPEKMIAIIEDPEVDAVEVEKEPHRNLANQGKDHGTKEADAKIRNQKLVSRDTATEENENSASRKEEEEEDDDDEALLQQIFDIQQKNSQNYKFESRPISNSVAVEGESSDVTSSEKLGTRATLVVRRDEAAVAKRSYNTTGGDPALIKDYEAYKIACANNSDPSSLNRSTSLASRATSRGGESNSSSMPGAFAIENPMRESSIRQELLDSAVSSSSYVSIEEIDTNRRDESNNGLLTEASVSLSAATPVQESLGDAEAGQHVLEAFCVENTVFDAKIVQSEELQPENTWNWRLSGWISVFVGLLVIGLVIGLVVAVSQNGQQKQVDPKKIEPDPTVVPLQYMEREDALRAILAPLSGYGAFDEGSPEFSPDRKAALDWLVRDDRLPLVNPSIEWKIRQRYVLALLYFSTNGPGWKQQYYFSTNLDECDWSSIKTGQGLYDLNNKFAVKGVICNLAGKAERIIMDWNNLSGTLPHELHNFRDSLVALDVSGGSISGSIPASYSEMKKLESLIMEDQCLTGSIPNFSAASHPRIEVVNFSKNSGLYGSLNGLCDGSGRQVVSDCGGCSGYAKSPMIECDCCVCCNPDNFQCCDETGQSWITIYTGELSPNGHIPSFDKQCIPEKRKQWVRDECPCMIVDNPSLLFSNNDVNINDGKTIVGNVVAKEERPSAITNTQEGYMNVPDEHNSSEKSPFHGVCTSDCSAEGAIPSFNF